MPGRTSKLSTRSSSPSPSEGDFQKPTEKKKTCQLFNKGNWWFLFILKHHWIHELKNTREFSGLFVSGIQFDKSSQIRICFSRSKHPSPSMAPFSYFFTDSIPPAAGCLKIWRNLGGNPYHLSVFWGECFFQTIFSGGIGRDNFKFLLRFLTSKVQSYHLIWPFLVAVSTCFQTQSTSEFLPLLWPSKSSPIPISSQQNTIFIAVWSVYHR